MSQATRLQLQVRNTKEKNNKWRRQRSISQGPTDGWKYVHKGEPNWNEIRSAGSVENTWIDWLRNVEPTSGLKNPNIQLRRPSRQWQEHPIERLFDKDRNKTAGNIIQRSAHQMDLYLRSGDIQIWDLEGNIDEHPAVREHTLKWGSMKLKGPGNHNNHEGLWNLQLHLWNIGKVTVGLTKYKDSLDKSGKQITHSWVQYSSKADKYEKAFIADFLLNVSGYGCFFKVHMPPPPRWRIKRSRMLRPR